VSRHFDPTPINNPFDDPGLYVDLVFERRALLSISETSADLLRKILRDRDAFVTFTLTEAG
jgi:ribonuclease Z